MVIVFEISEMSYNDLLEDVPPLDQDEDSEEDVEREEF